MSVICFRVSRQDMILVNPDFLGSRNIYRDSRITGYNLKIVMSNDLTIRDIIGTAYGYKRFDLKIFKSMHLVSFSQLTYVAQYEYEHEFNLTISVKPLSLKYGKYRNEFWWKLDKMLQPGPIRPRQIYRFESLILSKLPCLFLTMKSWERNDLVGDLVRDLVRDL